MNLKYVFCSTLIGLIFAIPNAQGELVITGILDGTLSGGTPRAFELYTDVAIADFEADYQFQYASNSNNYGNVSTGFGAIAANTYFYVTNSTANMTTVFGSGLKMHQNGGITPTGNDSGRIQLKSDSSIVDEAYTNTSSSSVYQDSYMYRKDFTGPDSTYNAANWNFGGNNLLDSPNNTASQIGALVPFGTFQLTPVPEPTTIVMFGVAMAGLGFRRRK